MTDPKPIPVAEAREIRRAARVRDKAGLLAIQPGDHLALLDRLVATAQQAERRWVTCECGRGPREAVELVDPDSGVSSWLLADRCTECLLPAQPEV